MTSGGSRSAWMSAVSFRSCWRDSKLREKRITPPVRGCNRRRRSWSVSSKPSTSITAGPSGTALGCAIGALQHDAGAGEGALVADGHVVTGDPDLVHEHLEVGVELESRLAEPVRDDADALKGDGIAEPGAHRFGERFLRREAVGDEEHRIARLLVAGPFAPGEHAACEALAELVEEPGDAMRLDDVDADAVDHAGCPSARR